ncbi:unnamed protein product, partial [Brassica rapa subsp. narinosa]
SLTKCFLITYTTKRIATSSSDEHTPEGGSKRLQRRRLETAPEHQRRRTPNKQTRS